MALSNIGGAEPSTITFKLATVTHDRGSTTEHQEIVVLGGQSSSLAIAVLTDTTPASTAYGLVVREAVPQSTGPFAVSSIAGPVTVRSSRADALVSVYQSSQAELRATIYQSTASELNVTVAGYVAPSTTVAVSTGSVRVHQSTAADLNVTVAGYVAPSTTVAVSTGSVRVHQSTAADLNVTVAGYSTTVNVSSLAGAVQARNFTSSGGSIEGSTGTPAAGALGLHIRPVLGSIQSTSILVNIGTGGGSTVLISSGAVTNRIFAMSVMSTVVGVSSCAFLSSAAKERWGLLIGSGSSGITGANLAVSPPAWLFATDASEALNFSASSTGLYRVSISYWQEA